MSESDDRPIHSFFGLSYANYLVLPRSVMQAMPASWQRQMAHLLAQASERHGRLYETKDYDVRLVERDEDGEVTKVLTDPLADYRHPVAELREKSVGQRIVEGLTKLGEAIRGGRVKFQVWYQWDGGLKHLRYEMPWPSAEADEMKADIDRMRQAWAERGDESPYSYKVVPRD